MSGFTLPTSLKGPRGVTPPLILNDMLGRVLVSNPETLFDSKFLYDKRPVQWTEALTGSATSVHQTGVGSILMSVTGGTDSATRQSRVRRPYQPGKSQLILNTLYAPQEANVTKRVGLFTATNGLFIQVESDDIKFVVRSNGSVTESYSQVNWNYDKMDGTGPSQFTLDMTAVQMFFVHFGWLGSGTVEFGFVINGIVCVCHKSHHGNNSLYTSAYLGVPNLPIRYEIVSSGGSGTLKQICSSVVAEGGTEITGTTRAVDNGGVGVTLPGTDNHQLIVAVRLNPLYLGATINSLTMSGLTKDAKVVRFLLALNPTISGSLTWNSLPGSVIQYAVGTGNTNGISAVGYVLKSVYVYDTGQVQEYLSPRTGIGSAVDGTPDVLALTAVSPQGGADVLGSIGFEEIV